VGHDVSTFLFIYLIHATESKPSSPRDMCDVSTVLCIYRALLSRVLSIAQVNQDTSHSHISTCDMLDAISLVYVHISPWFRGASGHESLLKEGQAVEKTSPRTNTPSLHAWTDGSFRRFSGVGWVVTANSNGEGDVIAQGSESLGTW